MVVRTEAVSLTPGQPVLSIGRQLPAQRLQLDSGLLELRFTSGATVILEGPADFEVASALRCVLHRGTVVARVPEQARGFTVEGPRGRLVDLGTEFGVRVGNSGDTEVHVLKGRVEAFPTNQQKAIELTENQALRLTSRPICRCRRTRRLLSRTCRRALRVQSAMSTGRLTKAMAISPRKQGSGLLRPAGAWPSAFV